MAFDTWTWLLRIFTFWCTVHHLYSPQGIHLSQLFFLRNQRIVGYCSVGCPNYFHCLCKPGLYSSPYFFTVCGKGLATYHHQLVWALAPPASHFNLLAIQFWVQKHAQERKRLIISFECMSLSMCKM